MSVPAVRSTELDLPREVQRAVELLFDRKAADVTLLDLRGLSTATDFFLLASGRSDTQVTAIAEQLVNEMREEGVRAGSVEGLRGGRWVLVDYFDFVVHVFHPEARDFYQLERLWGDAPTHQLVPDDPADSAPSD
ncbi:MAG: ribosome silencing factor [Gemmatimonadetes bacterium]|jgi:ribosome-associated protein|nr:ribosome silencing factor [Gemmatimonadota bacterium]MBA3969067.1 ribosome silencing factor [Gemmatimonadota bacterium]MDQ3308826.1 ribosome silencing factor [Gemmatimonadota bacterium]MDQ3521685.1 ribosome silencing factor [Gemmatimonadota bacterium]